MKKGINYAIYEFKGNLVNLLNESGLPSSILSMALKEVLQQVDSTAASDIEKEKEDFLKEGEADGQSV